MAIVLSGYPHPLVNPIKELTREGLAIVATPIYPGTIAFAAHTNCDKDATGEGRIERDGVDSLTPQAPKCSYDGGRIGGAVCRRVSRAPTSAGRTGLVVRTSL